MNDATKTAEEARKPVARIQTTTDEAGIKRLFRELSRTHAAEGQISIKRDFATGYTEMFVVKRP